NSSTKLSAVGPPRSGRVTDAHAIQASGKSISPATAARPTCKKNVRSDRRKRWEGDAANFAGARELHREVDECAARAASRSSAVPSRFAAARRAALPGADPLSSTDE